MSLASIYAPRFARDLEQWELIQALKWFRQGHDTSAIAQRMSVQECRVYNGLHRAREREWRGLA